MLDAVITLVDAIHILKQLDEHRVAAKLDLRTKLFSRKPIVSMKLKKSLCSHASMPSTQKAEISLKPLMGHFLKKFG